ncbi:MAG: ThuA domain-containing protein [Dictyoglomus sp.]
MKKVLALVGDYYHSEDKLKSTLDSVLEKEKFNVIYSSIEVFPSLLLDNPYLVIIARENKLNPQEENSPVWMNNYIETLLASYVKKGGKLLILHSGLASYKVDGIYVKEITRGYFKYHPERDVVRYYGKYPKSDVEINFELYDEHYFVEVSTNKTNVFLFSESKDGESIAGWYHQYGKGKIVCITPAHNEALEDEKYRKFLRDVITWL